MGMKLTAEEGDETTVPSCGSTSIRYAFVEQCENFGTAESCRKVCWFGSALIGEWIGARVEKKLCDFNITFEGDATKRGLTLIIS